ncbi:hypothetical protein DCS_05511 [Drechmeria coniospora]|uniref:Uncharacterized protein n=1 Tax=Drechmeria coniospora TaxID=98403 RepID=A0A151GN06_DRECN|nr:hypothetical protein DCS_05511 [Drechmeria coniospora]KYK58495.1 hypothetical protein DCS_05511 [Drechmeria coniospora]ODA83859.1 hypothetical protein RJ55_02375 [Drechmeria coniospora]
MRLAKCHAAAWALGSSRFLTPAAAAASASPIQPDHESAGRNCHHIFNAIHSAGRQWGSAVKHNGLSFFPAAIPKGTLLYHGSNTDSIPRGPEWLAFEVEHAEAFALSVTLPGRQHDQLVGQKPLIPSSARRRDAGRGQQNRRGYLHTYRAERDLKILYLDGMSAGKTHMGTLDTQDLLLRENNTPPAWDSFMDELDRAGSICDLMTEWAYDGFVRLEIGFEVVYCNFSNGIDLVAMKRTLLHPDADKSPYDPMKPFQWARAASERYDGIGGHRLTLDFSSMVSAFFFPVDLSNTDANRPDLPRLVAVSLDELRDIKAYLREVCTQPRRYTVNWQAVVDMIVTRYSARFALMASTLLSPSDFVEELDVVSRTYFDAPSLPGDITVASPENRTAEAIDSCTVHYLLPTYLDRDRWDVEDDMIHTALKRVVGQICNQLFVMRAVILKASARDDPLTDLSLTMGNDGGAPNLDEAVARCRQSLERLREDLSWTTWRRPQACPVNELLMIAMWPLGDAEDYWTPRCRSVDEVGYSRRSYWRGT